MTARECLLRAALKRSVIALDDWLHQYAPFDSDTTRIKESSSRVYAAGGTLAYLADVQHQNRTALKWRKRG